MVGSPKPATSTTPSCSPRSPRALKRPDEIPPPWVSGPNCSPSSASRAADLWRFTAGAVDQPNPVEIQRAAESNPIEKVLANWAVGTDPGVHIGAVQAVLDAGAVPFLHFPQDDPITAIDFYRTNVLPELR